MRAASSDLAAPGLQTRHTVAAWLGRRSLRARFLVIVALAVAAVVLAVSRLEIRSFERTLESRLTEDAQLTAKAVADDLLTRAGTIDPDNLRDVLHEFAEANPVIRSISVVSTDAGAPPALVASTQSEERDEVLALATLAVAAGHTIVQRRDALLSSATPVDDARRPMVAVATVSLASVDEVRSHGIEIALLFALPVIVLITLVIDLTMRALVHRPVADIQQTMARAAGGDLAARAGVRRPDELGTVATGLNDMLDRLEHFNAELQARVRDATSELRVRNRQLEASYTELLSVREALSQAERLAALGQMAANVAHQAGTPLNLISGYVQVIRDDPATDARTRARLEIVETQIRQVTRVLRSMLDEARRPQRRERTSLGAMITRVTELARPRLAESEVEVETVVPPDLPALDVDVAQMELALLALVRNALDAMPHGGRLVLRAAATAHGVRLEVADTGPGIAPAVRDRLFEPGVTTKPLGQGTGLGLSIVRDVIRSHGGEITAGEQSPTGAVFTIELPGADAADAAGAEAGA